MASNSVVSLPRFIVLKSPKNDKYLIHKRDDKSRLQFSGTEMENLHVKFEIVPSTDGSTLVHLKSCYNNKYWVIHPNQYIVSADAFEKEEDLSKPLCTLFHPVFSTSSTKIAFYHIHRKSNVMFSDTSPFYLKVGDGEAGPFCLNVGDCVVSNDDYLNFWNWELLPILPKFIALKGDNEHFLNTYTGDSRIQMSWSTGLAMMQPTFGAALLFNDEPRKTVVAPGYVYLRFNCKEKGEQGVMNQVFTNPDGTIRIKNIHANGFWRRSPNWIWPDSSDETNDNRDTLFEVTKLSHNKIALKNLGNDKFITRLSVDGKNDCLNASSTTIPERAKFEVVEIVTKREIYNVNFHLEETRDHKTEIRYKAKSTESNNTSLPQKTALGFDYTLEQSEEWTTSSSLKLSAETEITFGPPEIAQGKVKLGTEVTKEVKDGKTIAISRKETFLKNIDVPPRSKVVADLLVTKVICDIPYSYSQSETLSNGLIVTSERDDGLYTTVETHILCSTKELPI